MELHEMQHLTGCATFYECWRWIKEMGKENLGVITMQKKKHRYDLIIKEIREAAALEVMDRLPTDATILIMHEIVADNCPHGPDRNLIHTFLNNLLTR